jgi:hypothetical protein
LQFAHAAPSDSGLQVKVQSEVNHSHSRHQKVCLGVQPASDQATRGRHEPVHGHLVWAQLMEAMEALRVLSQLDPPPAKELFARTREVSALILERSLFLDCIRPGAPHAVPRAEKDTTTPVPNARAPSRTAKKGKKKSKTPVPKSMLKSVQPAPAAGVLQKWTWQGAHGLVCRMPCCSNTLPVALRGMRLTVEEWPLYPEASFLGRITQWRTACRDDILQAAVSYYEKG